MGWKVFTICYHAANPSDNSYLSRAALRAQWNGKIAKLKRSIKRAKKAAKKRVLRKRLARFIRARNAL